MRSLVLVLCITLTACQRHFETNGKELSATEQAQLERKAANGDSAAAWRLYIFHALCNGTDSDPWLRRAAELKHPQAQRWLAHLIKDCEHSPDGFGASAPTAVQSLLDQAAQSEGDACDELASAYAEGYFGAPDQAKARAYFQRGAGFNYRTCWEKLAHYYRHGIGGSRDDAEAYYWISIEARCVDPRSISGKETWAMREEVAGHLSLPVLEQEWKRIDTFIARVNAKEATVEFAPFLSGMIDPKLEAESRLLSLQRENEHRKKWKLKNALLKQ